ncbi:hypothetical protein RB195_025187 [Necator americanus]|uniref:Uncharacterized protein n=1 Tax=Necator americanus TaxID=51031 RepID=A0ABR1ERC0_NECAM
MPNALEEAAYEMDDVFDARMDQLKARLGTDQVPHHETCEHLGRQWLGNEMNGKLLVLTSDRPKACNQVTGRCKGGGLESPPTNKHLMSSSGERNVFPKAYGTRGLQPDHGF